MKIAITGSNGFIGGELLNYFINKGDEVLLLQRKQPAPLSKVATYVPYDLNESQTQLNLLSCDALIHTAYMPFKAGNDAGRKNVDATLSLYEQCKKQGVLFVFLSSMSAHENALSEYGKHKFELEQKLGKENCLILKLGLVLGKQGLFSRIQATVKKTGVAVLVGGGNQPIQVLYMGDLLSCIYKCITEKRTGTYLLANPKVYSMRGLFSEVAAKENKKIRFVSVPYSLVSLGISAIELLHLPFPVSGENLLGLKQLRAFDTSADLKTLGINLMDLKQALEYL